MEIKSDEVLDFPVPPNSNVAESSNLEKTILETVADDNYILPYPKTWSGLALKNLHENTSLKEVIDVLLRLTKS